MIWKQFTHLGNFPPELKARFNSFLTTEFDDSLSVEMQFRSIIKWCQGNFKTVDSLIDFINEISNWLKQFENNFDTKLEESVITVLSEWQASGQLDVVISEALQWQLDDYIVTNEQDKVSINQQLTQLVTNIKSFGAKGDGVTDDTQAFRDAINATPEYGTLFIPAPDVHYLLNPEEGTDGMLTAIHIDKPIKIVSTENALIKYADFARGFMNGQIETLFRITSSNVTIDGLQIDCNTDNLYMTDNAGYKWWFVAAPPNTELTEVRPKRTDVFRISQLPSRSNTGLKEIEIKNCRFYQGHTSIRFQGSYGMGDIITDVPDHLLITDCKVTNNYFYRNRGNCINLSGGVRRIIVESNEFINNYYHAYRNYWSADNCVVRNNYFYRKLKDMYDWNISFDNRWYVTNYTGATPFRIDRGLIRIGDGVLERRDIDHIQVYDNVLNENLDGLTQVEKEELSATLSTIMVIGTNGGHSIRDNIILGGAYGITYNTDAGLVPDYQTVIANNELQNIYHESIRLRYLTTNDFKVSANTTINHKKDALEKQDYFNIFIATTNSPLHYQQKADIITTDNLTDTLGKVFELLPQGGKVVLASGSYQLTSAITVLKENITIEGINKGVVINSTVNEGITFRSKNGVLKNLTLTTDNETLNGMMVRGENITLDSVDIRGFNTGLTIRDSNYFVLKDAKLSNNQTAINFAGSSLHTIIDTSHFISNGTDISNLLPSTILGANFVSEQ